MISLEQWLLNLIILVIVAFVPSIVYLIWIRNSERFGREPWGDVLRLFAWGAVFAVIISIVFELVMVYVYGEVLAREYVLFSENPSLETLVVACVIAPVVEEAAKAYGVMRRSEMLSDVEGGLVLGAAGGLGFAATENLLYEASALQEGVIVFVVLAFVRSISCSLLHASASAVSGYGIAKKELGAGISALPYYLLAVGMHALFNLLASIEVLMEGVSLFGLVLVVLFAWASIYLVRRRIRE
jgi:RsiW-degrading membrane proteinase PrsW (M82 family)